MSLAASTDDYRSAPSASVTPSSPAVRVRDPRLDFFRGIAMFIILIAHTPGNWLTLWIPARWGFSDATEIFVFCSGMASAIAFGATFQRAGWLLGTARVAYRVWQVYWAHVGLFFATLALTVYLTDLEITTRNYWGQLNLWMIFVESDKWTNPNILLSFMTLQWVPNYFDILPMYMVVLVMMPIMIALKQVNVGLALGVSVALWLATQIWSFGFSAEPWTERQWFFNPFGWQLIFYTGFALMAGWLPKPPVTPLLIALAIAVLVVSLPFAAPKIYRAFEALSWVREWRSDYNVLINKSDFGILRYIHFLALAYLAWVAVGERGHRLLPPETAGVFADTWRVVLAAIMTVGQQSLAVFVTSMFFARYMGFLFDVFGRSHWSMIWVNALGFSVLILVAYTVGWFKSAPWKPKKKKDHPRAAA